MSFFPSCLCFSFPFFLFFFSFLLHACSRACLGKTCLLAGLHVGRFYACPISTVVLGNVEFDTGKPFLDAITVNEKIYYAPPLRMIFFFFFLFLIFSFVLSLLRGTTTEPGKPRTSEQVLYFLHRDTIDDAMIFQNVPS